MTLRAANPPLAIAFMLTATAFIAATMVMAKSLGTDTLGPPLHPLQISHGRFLFAFIAITAAAVILRPVAQPNLTLRLQPAHAFGWGGVTLMFAAVAFIPLADATAISFLNPVFAMLLAIPLLGERVGPVRWARRPLPCSGALILLRPTPESFQPAALLALGAALVMGMELIFIKKLSGREAAVPDPADQQRDRARHRARPRSAGLDRTNAGAMGRVGRDWGC